MRVLALDTALGACSVALCCNGDVLARRFARLERGHAEALMPMVEAVRGEVGLDYAELDLLAATVGPGTFTGVRIGLATARALSLASGVPLVGVTTLAAVAEAAAETAAANDSLLVVHDARRAQVYAQLFDRAVTPLGDPGVIDPADIAMLARRRTGLVAGTGVALVWPYLRARHRDWRRGSAEGVPDAAVIARLAARSSLGGQGEADMRRPPEPLYLRPAGAVAPDQGAIRKARPRARSPDA